MILDTTFLIDVLNGDPDAERRRIELDERGDASVSAVSVFQLAEGAHLSDWTGNGLRAIMAFLSRLRVVPIGGEVALLAGELSEELIGRGERIEVEDVFVGATALHIDTAILTRTVDGFERIPGVTVESYRDRRVICPIEREQSRVGGTALTGDRPYVDGLAVIRFGSRNRFPSPVSGHGDSRPRWFLLDIEVRNFY